VKWPIYTEQKALCSAIWGDIIIGSTQHNITIGSTQHNIIIGSTQHNIRFNYVALWLKQ